MAWHGIYRLSGGIASRTALVAKGGPDPATTYGLALIATGGMDSPQVDARDSWPDFGMTWRVQWPLAASFNRSSWYRTQGA
ncbi:hypothetical protein GCM10010873_32420 [Cypionkella aquatica]|uniref:Uncharacterized protein n=1 Tax=Cypionkella aquatica TaxID=1756042 RepID=A0AA37TZT0_9RHOB|nr:hypothetical protein [Cypionkella aquatica]GLS88268.1 hypothetical protein GCM10010873_32420 [Cypionkella aquatica]